MRIFHNAINIKKDPDSTEGEEGDELASDSFPYTIVDDVIYKLKLSRRSDKVGDDFDIGANPSQEEACEGTDSSEVSGLDCVLNHRLKECQMDSARYFKAYIKAYAAALKPVMAKKYDAETAKERLGKLSKIFKTLLDNFDDLEFFTGENYNASGTLLIVQWDEVTPYAYIPIDGITEEKQ